VSIGHSFHRETTPTHTLRAILTRARMLSRQRHAPTERPEATTEELLHGGERQFAAGRGLAESKLLVFKPVQLWL